MVRSCCVSLWMVTVTVAFGAAAQTTRPVTTRPAASRPKPVDPFAEGSQVEAKWGNSWYTATVVTRTAEGAAIKFRDGREEAKQKTELRVRGVTTDEVKPDFMVRYFGRDAHVEYAQGPWWQDGLIVKRDGPRALVREAHGFTNWKELSELRSREVAPGGVGTIAPPPVAPAAVAEKAPGAPAVPKGAGTPAAADRGSTGESLEPPEKSKVADASAAKALALESFQGVWSAHPDPASNPVRSPGRGAIALPPVVARSTSVWEQFHEDEVRVYVPAGATSGLVVQEARLPKDGLRSQAVRVDFATGSASAAVELPRGPSVTAASPDGKRVALQWRDVFKKVHGGVVRVASVEGRSAETVAEFKPFAPRRDGDVIVHGVAFLDADHVLFAAGVNDVALVDVAKLAIVWSGNPGSIGEFAISPGGHQLALPTDAGVFLVEPMTGNPIGHFEGEARRWGWMRFSDDGSRLAAYDNGALCVWDVGNGQVIATAEVSARGQRGGPAPRIDWLSNDYLLLDGTRLVDVAKSTVVWTYQYGEATPPEPNQPKVARPPVLPGGAAVGGRLWFAWSRLAPLGPIGESKARLNDSLVAATLPEPGVTQQLASAKPEELYSISPGTKVSLSVNVQTADAQKLNGGITDALAKVGLVAVGADHAAEATVRLEGSTAAGDSKTVQYQRTDAFGLPTAKESATLGSTKLRVALVRAADGKVLWERTATAGGGGPPSSIWVKAGESAQEAVNRQQTSGFDWFFTGARYPKYLSKGGEGRGFGSSLLTDKGPQPAPPAKP